MFLVIQMGFASFLSASMRLCLVVGVLQPGSVVQGREVVGRILGKNSVRFQEMQAKQNQGCF